MPSFPQKSRCPDDGRQHAGSRQRQTCRGAHPRSNVSSLAVRPGWTVPRSTWPCVSGAPCGGWCPRGRLAEDGPISPVYPLSEETTLSDYAVRTAWNVRDSDATLVLAAGPLTGVHDE